MDMSYITVEQNNNLTPRPTVGEEDFGEMCFRIYDSVQYDYAINVRWFIPSENESQLGQIVAAWGVVKELSFSEKRLHLVCDWDSNWINIEDLVSVSKGY